METTIISLITGLIAGYIAFRSNSENNSLKYITDERRKWRDKMRSLSADFLNIEKSIPLNIQKLKTIKNKIQVRLNPDDLEDKKILILLEDYILKVEAKKENDFVKLEEQIINAFAVLLKYDWERAKKETKKVVFLKPIFIINLSIVVGLIYFIKEYLTYNLYCFHELNGIYVFLFLLGLFLFLFLYFISNVLWRLIKNNLEENYKKSNCFSDLLGIIVRTKL